MNEFRFDLCGAALCALPSGALWWPDKQLLCVSDMHLGKSERIARLGGSQLPPYETRDTLDRLARDLEATKARRMICLGDSFDDIQCGAELPEDARAVVARLQAGRDWIWIEGNHDPGPSELGGSHLAELQIGPLTFRHIAEIGCQGEVSGHYHPKARIKTRLRSVSRPAFLKDNARVILPAYGTYTGGLRCNARELSAMMQSDAIAVLTGSRALAVAMPR